MAKFNEVVAKRAAKNTEEKLTLQDLEDPNKKKNIVDNLRYRITNKIQSGEIQKVLPPWLDKRIKNHFKKGGLGF